MVVLFASISIFMNAFAVRWQEQPLVFAWLCGLLLVVTAGPGRRGGLVSRR